MNSKKSEEILAELYRNSQLALLSISDLLPAVEDGAVREELMRQHEEYEKFGGRAAQLAKDKNIEIKPPNPMKKAMMWSSIKMSTLTDNSRSHIADMMVQGTVMGITAIRSSLGEASDEAGDEDILTLARDFLKAEEQFEKKWKSYL